MSNPESKAQRYLMNPDFRKNPDTTKPYCVCCQKPFKNGAGIAITVDWNTWQFVEGGSELIGADCFKQSEKIKPNSIDAAKNLQHSINHLMTPEAKPVSTPTPWHNAFDPLVMTMTYDISLTKDQQIIAVFKNEKDANFCRKAVNRDHLFDELVEALETLTYQGNTLENIVKAQKLVTQAKELSK